MFHLKLDKYDYYSFHPPEAVDRVCQTQPQVDVKIN